MTQNVHKYLDKIDDLQDEIKQSADGILDSIDLDELIKSPEDYLNGIALRFLKEHKSKIDQGFKIGRNFASKVI